MTGAVTWASSTPGIATISPAGLATGVALGRTGITAALGSLAGRISLTVLPPLRAITIPPSSLTISGGQTVQLRAFGTFADGSNLDITAFAAWASDAPYLATVAAGRLTAHRPGSATITATLQGVTGTLALTATAFAPTITITSPTDGATLNADRVLVRGTVSGATTDMGVVVNGAPAFVNGIQWATQIPLVQGPNAITATATDATEAQFTTSIDVTVPQATPAPLILQAVPNGGVSPLMVAFTAVNQTGRTLVQFEFDPTGSGTFGAPTPTFAGARATYTGSGLLFPTLRATDDQGTQHTATTIVNLEDPITVTARFQARWNSFKARLRAGDIPGALRTCSGT